MSVRAVKGMAHFAGTGPSGTYCHECKHWSGKRPQWEGQAANMGSCALSKPLTPKGKLVRFKGNELSCNKFSPHAPP